MDWKEWKRRYGAHLRDESGGFELRFFERVLTRMKSLDPSSVKSQTRFEDLSGRARYIDFTIEEGNQVRIALEVDGWDKTGRKTGMTKQQFQEWSFRELSMAAQGWTPLRFANTLLKNSPGTCREFLELRLEMERQRAALIESGSKQGKELEAARAELEAAAERARDGEAASGKRFFVLQKEQAEAEAALLPAAGRERFEELQAEIDRVSRQLEEERHLRKETEEENRGMKVMGIVFGVAVVVVGVVAVFAISSGGGGSDSTKTLQQVQCEEGVSASQIGTSDVGSVVTVKGQIAQVSDRGGNVPLLLNMGGSYPNQDLAIKIWRNKLENWGVEPEDKYLGRTVSIKGELENYEDAAENSSPLEIEANAVNDIAICS